MAHETAHAAGAHGHGHGEHPNGGKSTHHGGRQRGGHGNDHGGGGGHGGSWIITYCDMITLLIACFICIITFASSEKEKYAKKRDSLLFGTGGVGIAGPTAEAMELDSVVARPRPLAARLGTAGSEVLPMHDSPGMDAASEVIRQLDAPIPGTLQDSYALQLPMRLLLGPDNKLTEVGTGILHSIADNVRRLPYDIYFQVDDPAALTKAVTLSAYLGQQESIPPGRLGIGLRNASNSAADSIWLFFARQR
jgi:chemotaxis protein MotB